MTIELKRLTSRAVQHGLRALGALACATAGTAVVATSAHAATVGSGTTSYSFRSIADAADPPFNQFLGINASGEIAGYFGSGMSGQPNQGFTVTSPYGQGNFANENFPGSAQTQVTAVNGKGDTAGFWVDSQGETQGFTEWNGVFSSFRDPNTPAGIGFVNQLLGIDNKGLAVGYYLDAIGNAHAYTVNQSTGVFTNLKAKGMNEFATGIDNQGDIVGYGTPATGTTSSWLDDNGKMTKLEYPGASETEALGIAGNYVVGIYYDGSGVANGFVLTDPLGPAPTWQTVDDPSAVTGTTVVNGVNSKGELVGYYLDDADNTDAFIATP